MPAYQKRHQTIFTTVRSEGAILPMDLLQRIAQGDSNLHGLTPESYYLLKTEKLNESINRSWNRLLSAWVAFEAAREKLPERDAGTTLTRERWLLTLFYELGYGRLLTSKPNAHSINCAMASSKRLQPLVVVFWRMPRITRCVRSCDQVS